MRLRDAESPRDRWRARATAEISKDYADILGDHLCLGVLAWPAPDVARSR